MTHTFHLPLQIVHDNLLASLTKRKCSTTMAFLSAPAVGTRAFAAGDAVRSCSAQQTARATATTMKYGDYDYKTDRTKGHVGQYYVDKFRIASDFSKGIPASEADSALGRNSKGQVAVPVEGIPQIVDDAILARDPESKPDARLTEIYGNAYPWDSAYDPSIHGGYTLVQGQAGGYALPAPAPMGDLDDESVADDAFSKFRGASAGDRGSALSKQDLDATTRAQMRAEGYTENFLLTIEGQHDRLHSMVERLKQVPFLTPYGKPQSEVAGNDYLGSVGALDFLKKKEEEIAFWKDTVPEKTYKRPMGANTPDLPYNTAPSIGAIKEGQAAAGIIPAAE